MQKACAVRVKSMPNNLIRLICLGLCLAPGHAGSVRDPATLCDEAARAAGTQSDVPLNILLAITRVETGRGAGGDLRPWPWTINQAGSGRWFDTAAEATTAAETALTTGSGNLDIGCFQLNHRWHGDNFASLTDMFDPETNARYAAGFLSDLFREKRDWPAAVAAYHSRSDGPAEVYLARIETVLGDLGDLPVPIPVRQNSYPLLQAGAHGSGGSLVPRLTASRPLIGAAP